MVVSFIAKLLTSFNEFFESEHYFDAPLLFIYLFFDAPILKE